MTMKEAEERFQEAWKLYMELMPHALLEHITAERKYNDIEKAYQKAKTDLFHAKWQEEKEEA
mgnify:CR=1 FL=1